MIYTTGHSPTGGIILAGDIATLVVSPGSCTHEIPVTVTMTASQEGWEIRYTTDGSEPTATSTLYEGPLVFTGDVTVKAKGFKGALETEAVESVYELVPPIVITPSAGTFDTWVEASLSCADPDYTLHVTTDGTTPDGAAPLYDGPWWVSADVLIKAVGIRGSDGRHTFIKAAAIDLDLASVTVAPGAGDHYYRYPQDAPEIVVTCNRPGHTLHYGLDGTAPAFGGDPYAGPLPLLASCTFRVVARKDGVPASAVRTQVYAMRTMLTVGTVMTWGESGEMLAHGTGMPWRPAAGVDARYGFPWGPTGRADTSHSIRWLMAREADARVGFDWSGTRHVDTAGYCPWWPVQRADARASMPWSETGRADVLANIPWARTGRVDVATMLRWTEAQKIDFATSLPWGPARAVDVKAEIPWTGTRPVDVTHYTPFLPGETEPVKEKIIKQIGIPWMAVARALMIRYEIVCERVSDKARIPLLAGSVSIDENGWMWALSAGIAEKGLDLVKPGADGAKVEIELKLNGYAWRFHVMGYAKNENWGQGTYSITGKSVSRVLGGEGAPKLTKVYRNTTAEQIVASELSALGFSHEWNLLANTWNVDGEYSVAGKTAVEIAGDIASAVGGVVQSHPHEKRLILQRRHWVSPKDHGTATADEVLLQGVIDVAASYEESPRYNSVVVSGTSSGVVVPVVRSGTDGARQAPPVTGDLLTNQAVCMERAREILDEEGYDKETYLLEAPMAPVASGQRPKLMTPGMLAGVMGRDDVMFMGRVTGVEVGFSNKAGVKQRITCTRYLT